MAQPILVIGPSGTGKSTSIENLDPKETFIIKVTDKQLPFRGCNKKYTIASKNNPKGNMMTLKEADPGSRYGELLSLIRRINIGRQDIKNVVIDDFQYLMIDEYMKRSQEGGFQKFGEMAKNMWSVLDLITICRAELNFIILCHSNQNDQGLSTMQTIGNMISSTVKPEGKFTIILHTIVRDNQYKFITQFRSYGGHDYMAKSPKGMFDEDFIDNDMNYVLNRMNEYYDEEFGNDTVLMEAVA